MTLAFLYDHKKPIPEWHNSMVSDLPFGTIKAITAILCRTQGNFVRGSWQVQVSSSRSQKRIYKLEGNSQKWLVGGAKSYLLAVGAIVDAIYLFKNFLNTPHITADKKRIRLAKGFNLVWNEFIDELHFFIGDPPPYTSKRLSQVSQVPELNVLLSKVIEALNKYLSHCIQCQIKIVDKFASSMQIDSSGEWERVLFGTGIVESKIESPLVKDLQRAIARGMTALLAGPTGVGKTESVKKACMGLNALLVQVSGHPGLDDRQLFGSTYPDGNGDFSYVEGPLTEAWRYAAEGQLTVLLIDELARMDPYYHAVLIGALDSQSGREIKARPRIYNQVKDLILDEERYYVLSLPNGTHLVAPIVKLSLIATTNLGNDYFQATSQLDPALLRRFQLQFDVERLDETTRVNILRKQGLPRKIAQIIVDLDDFTVNHTATNGSLLRDGANLGVLLNWGCQARILFDEENCWEKALFESAKTTLVPFVCPRLSDGRLEPPAVEMVLDELKHSIQAILYLQYEENS